MLCERRISGPRSGLKHEPARRFRRNADWTSEIDMTVPGAANEIAKAVLFLASVRLDKRRKHRVPLRDSEGVPGSYNYAKGAAGA